MTAPKDPGAPNGRTRTARLKWAIFVRALPAGLLLAEGLVRVMGWTPAPEVVYCGSILRKLPGSPLRHENLPGSWSKVEIRDSRGAPPRVHIARVNLHGLRGPEVEVEVAKPKGVYRIACLGDSHTFGTGVAEGEPWPSVLGELYTSSSDGRPVQVMNWGMGAYDTLQELEQLRSRVLEYQPDLVLVQYFVNEIYVLSLGADFELERGPLFRLSNPRRGGRVAALRQASHAADMVLQRVFERERARGYPAAIEVLYSEESRQWLAVREALREFRDELESRGIGFGVVMFPMLLEQDEHFVSHAALQVVANFCRAEGIACLDAEPDLRAARGEQLRVSPSDWHANARAHRAFAVAVAEWLRERGEPD